MYSIVCGGVVAVVYDLFRLLRVLFFKNKVGFFICDFLFAVISGFLSVMFSIGFSRGSTRYFIIIGELLGFLFYRLTIGRFTVRIFEFIFAKLSAYFIKTVEKIGKTGKKVLQVTCSVLYNIVRKSMLPWSKALFKRGKFKYGKRTKEKQK